MRQFHGDNFPRIKILEIYSSIRRIYIKILNDGVMVVGRGRKSEKEKVAIVASSLLALLLSLRPDFVDFPDQNRQPKHKAGGYPEIYTVGVTTIKVKNALKFAEVR